jgi:hypothetical protein
MLVKPRATFVEPSFEISNEILPNSCVPEISYRGWTVMCVEHVPETAGKRDRNRKPPSLLQHVKPLSTLA